MVNEVEMAGCCCVVQRDGELATDTKQGDWRVLVGCILTFGFACRVSGPE